MRSFLGGFELSNYYRVVKITKIFLIKWRHVVDRRGRQSWWLSFATQTALVGSVILWSCLDSSHSLCVLSCLFLIFAISSDLQEPQLLALFWLFFHLLLWSVWPALGLPRLYLKDTNVVGDQWVTYYDVIVTTATKNIIYSRGSYSFLESSLWFLARWWLW